MRSTILHKSVDVGRLRLMLAGFFLALALPTAVLIFKAYTQLKWEGFHHHRVMAEELATRIDANLIRLMDVEESRSFADYSFNGASGDAPARVLQRSPLSHYPVSSDIPGLLGYFQIDADGAFSSPLTTPTTADAQALGIPNAEMNARFASAKKIHELLAQNRLAPRDITASREVSHQEPQASGLEAKTADDESRLLSNDAAKMSERLDEPTPASISEAPAQSAFDYLNEYDQSRKQEKSAATALGRVSELNLKKIFQDKLPDSDQTSGPRELAASPAPELRARSRQQAALPVEKEKADRDYASDALEGAKDQRIHTFESELDPFSFSLLENGYFVMFRKVWRSGQRYIQGALIEQKVFLENAITQAFLDTALAQSSDLLIAFRGDVLLAIGGSQAEQYLSSSRDFNGELLFQTRMSAPLSDIEIIISVNQLPVGPGGVLIVWLAVILSIMLCGGFYALYRLGLGQIRLARQQQDFVSAVSHELKTPLTSIRMYGEMLREGWVSEDKKRRYYDFIYEESERLSRLINNVLQLARLTHRQQTLALKPLAVSELIDRVKPKLETQIQGAGFALDLDMDSRASATIINIDADCFTQVLINLVDNAIKFSAKSETRRIALHAVLQADHRIRFSVRDHGPGIPKNQMKKIFELFYRSENELTRETVGTGIGLALVHQMMLSMGGKVDVRNCEPGAEFSLYFPGQAAD